jgi:hypothetical protein
VLKPGDGAGLSDGQERASKGIKTAEVHPFDLA